MSNHACAGRRAAITASLALGLAIGIGSAVPAAAQEANWPTRPIRIMVPYAAGGSTDILSRLFAQKVGEILGQPVVIENKGGAGGNVGVVSYVNSTYDDHYFLMVSQSQLSINQYLFKERLGYNPLTDLQTVALTAQTTNVIVVPPKLPVKSLKELVDYSKANPGKVSYSSAGIGSTGHLLNELFKTTTKIDVVHVPYKGNGPAMQAVLAGEVQFNTDNMPQLLQQVKGEKLRPLAVTSAQRWFQLPDVPTVTELGYPGLTTVVWFGLVSQARMPKTIVARMNQAVQKALADPEFTAKLRENSLEGTPGTPGKMAEQAASERVRWKAVVEASGATAE